MKLPKTAFPLVVLIALIVVIAAGCGATETTEGTTTSAPGATTTGTDGTTTTTQAQLGTVTIMGVWGGSELESFNQVLAQWQEESGGRAEFEGTRDLTAILRARVQGGNPPDLAILPNPALLQEFAQAGILKPITDVVGSDIEGNYAETWIEQGSVDDQLYGMFLRASTKNCVWYSPRQFTANNYQIPADWDAMLALTEQIRSAGGPAPWAIGVESAAASGWPASDWVQEILLHESGPDVYDQWVRHEIPWTDPAVRSAFERFGEIALTEGNVTGGGQAIIATNNQDAVFQVYQDPPQAYMDFHGSFAQGFIEAQFPDLEPVQDYDFFALPAINEQYANSATGGADVIVMFNDTPTARALLQYMATAEAWQSWAETGGFTTPNRALDPSTYPDEIVAKSAQQLTDSEIFRIDADDLMPATVQQAFWAGLLAYLGGTDLDTVLNNIESTAAGAYTTTTSGPTTTGGATTTTTAGTTTSS